MHSPPEHTYICKMEKIGILLYTVKSLEKHQWVLRHLRMNKQYSRARLTG